jgi:menaquinone-dependent protoporphyrinogen oxidase
VLIAVASAQGATREIGRTIRDTLDEHGIHADLVPPDAVSSLSDYDVVILGSAVYTGHWLTPARDFATRFAGQLAERDVWLFSSGPVGDPARKMVQLMDKEPAEVMELVEAICPHDHRMFAGKLDPRQLHGLQRASLLLFRGLSGDFRDWGAIRSWANEIAADLTAASAC